MADALLVAGIALGGALFSAIFGGAVAVLGIYLTQFVAENFRRFRDGSALAAALLGELRAYRPGAPNLIAAVNEWEELSRNGQKDRLGFRKFDDTKLAVWESSVGKVGLLGVGLVEDVVLVYSKMTAVAVALTILHDHYQEMPAAEFEARCRLIASQVEDIAKRADVAIPRLEARASARFIKNWTWLFQPWRWHGGL